MIHRHRRRLTGITVSVLIAGGLAWHHSDVSMAAMHHEDAAPAIEMCLGAFTAVGAVIVAVTMGLVLLGARRGRATPSLPLVRCPAGRHRPTIRAGPAPLLRCCVLRL